MERALNYSIRTFVAPAEVSGEFFLKRRIARLATFPIEECMADTYFQVVEKAFRPVDTAPAHPL